MAEPAQVLLPLHPRKTPPEFALLNALVSTLFPPPPVFPLLVLLLLTQVDEMTPLETEAEHVEKVVRHCRSQFVPSHEVTGA